MLGCGEWGTGRDGKQGRWGRPPLPLTGARQGGRGTGEALSVKEMAGAGGATPPLQRGRGTTSSGAARHLPLKGKAGEMGTSSGVGGVGALSVKGMAGAGSATPPIQREAGDDLFRRCAPPSPKGEGWGDGDLFWCWRGRGAFREGNGGGGQRNAAPTEGDGGTTSSGAARHLPLKGKAGETGTSSVWP